MGHSQPINIVYYQRKPGGGHFSIERLFTDIRSTMPADINVKTCTSRYYSQGFFRRAHDVLRATWHQGDINHIEGDVHFLSYLLHKQRTILTIHDCVTLERLKGIRYWIFWFFWYWLPSKKCQAITVISKSTKHELQQHLRNPNLNIEIIPDCVSQEFQPSPKEFNAIQPRILQIGTKKNKNIERVIVALGGLSCCFVIIGKLSEQQKDTLERYNIHYENHVGISNEELLIQYQQSDIVMFASLYEGFGLPIIEANAIGRPVVTSKLYSMPEVGGAGGCYVDPYNEKDIRSAVNRIITDQDYRQRLISNGLHNAKRFSPEIIANQYASLYKRLFKQL